MIPVNFPQGILGIEGEYWLEGYSQINAVDLWNLIVSDREHPKRKRIWPGSDSLQALQKYMTVSDFKDPFSEEFGYLIRDKKNTVVGTFHIHSINWENAHCEVGYWLHHSKMGEGIIAKTLTRVEVLLCDMGFKKSIIETVEWNQKSWAIAERAGYKLSKKYHTKIPDCPGCDDCSKVYEKVLQSF